MSVNPITWVLDHEPAIAGSFAAATGVATALGTSTGASGLDIGGITAALALVGPAISRWTTSNATKAKIQDSIDHLPQIMADVSTVAKSVDSIKAGVLSQHQSLFETSKKFIDDHIAGRLDEFDKSVDDAVSDVAAAGKDAEAAVVAIVKTPAKPTPVVVAVPAPVSPVVVEPTPEPAAPVAEVTPPEDTFTTLADLIKE